MKDPNNLDRASWAQSAIDAFCKRTRTEKETALRDLLCDLMHWARAKSIDFERELDIAREHFEAEVTDEDGPSAKSIVEAAIIEARIFAAQADDHGDDEAPDLVKKLDEALKTLRSEL